MRNILIFPSLIALLLGFLQVNAQNCQANFSSVENSGVVTFTNGSTGVNSMGYAAWDFGDGTTGSTAATSNTTHTYASNGLYLACLTVFDSLSSCSSTFCDSVLVTGASGGASCQAGFSTTISGGMVMFSNTSTNLPAGGGNAQWDFGDGTTTSSGLNVGTSHNYTANGTYTVCLVINGNNCTDTICQPVTITGVGTGSSCTAFFSTNFSGNTVNFQNISSNLYPTGTSIWDFGDGTTQTVGGASGVSHTYATPGTYLVCLSISDSSNNCSDTWCDSVVVSGGGGPPCQASYWWVNDTSGQYTVLLYNTSTGGSNASYFWDFGDGNTSTQAYPTHVYAGTGTYVICVTMTDSNCTSTYCDSVVVAYKTNTPFSINVVGGITTSTAEPVSSVTVNAYPVPFDDYLSIDLVGAKRGIIRVNLFDLTGRSVMTSQIDASGANHQKLNTAALPAGTYLLRIEGKGVNETRKVIKF